MKIKKGDWLRCIKDVIMEEHLSHRGRVITDLKEYSAGDYYRSEKDGCITNISGSVNHSWTEEGVVKEHFVKLYTIQDLKDGRVAVENDGTVEDIINVVKHCFNAKVYGNAKYYFENDGWDAGKRTGLPIQSVKDFLVQLPKEEEEIWAPKVGEKVEFKSFTSSAEWSVAEYLATDKRCKEPYALTYTSKTGGKFILTSPIIRQIPKKVKVTKQRVADILGIELNQLEIIN